MTRRRRSIRKNAALEAERERLGELLDSHIGLRDPSIQIYRLGADGKQELMGTVSLDVLKMGIEESIQNNFGAGKFLVRTVLSNGTFGPSRTVVIGETYPAWYEGRPRRE